MMNTLIAACICLMSLTVAGEEQSEDWFTFYYQNPQPQRFVEEYRKMTEAGVFAKKNAWPPVFSFLSRIMAQNPTRIPAWTRALDDLSDDNKQVLHMALWFSNTPQAAVYFQNKGLDEHLTNQAPDILAIEVDTPSVLDMLWGYFFATGQPQPIRRIVSALNLSEYEGAIERFKTSQKTEKDIKDAYLGAVFIAARWSLTSNCKQHDRVREICNEILRGDDLTEAEALWLGAVLAATAPDRLPVPMDRVKPNEAAWKEDGKPIEDAENRKSKDGFGAQLFLTEDASFFEDWLKPQPPAIKASDIARRGVPLRTIVIFVGPSLDENGHIDVDYDMTIKSPMGPYMGAPKVCWAVKGLTTPH